MIGDSSLHSSHEETPASIFVLTGVMASGKSTVAQLLAENFSRGVHLRGDTFHKMIISGRENFSPNSSDEGLQQLRLRYEITTSVADKYFNAGFTVVAQDVILSSFLMEFITNDQEPSFVCSRIGTDAASGCATRGGKGENRLL